VPYRFSSFAHLRSSTRVSRIVVGITACVAGAIVVVALGAVSLYLYLRPGLPTVTDLRDIRMQVPLRIYTRDGRLIATVGDQRRIPVTYAQIPPTLIQAFLATEDERFFEHPGVDFRGMVRATVDDLRAGALREGASTITQQLSRDLFLSPKRDLRRKLSEIVISLLLETRFSKQEIFSLYLNTIFMGERAFGVEAAAEVYFGKNLSQLSIAELATLAGIPAAPSAYNPAANPVAATARRHHVLSRMRTLHYISDAQYALADTSPMESHLHGPLIEVDAPYVAQMVRSAVQARYGDAAYTGGYRVYTTLDSRLQRAATVALRTGLLEYDRRHGWRGATATVAASVMRSSTTMELALGKLPAVGGLKAALVEKVNGSAATLYVSGIGSVLMPWDKLAWARRDLGEAGAGPPPADASQILRVGDVIYTVGNSPPSLQFVQVPQVQAALVSVDPQDGAVVALIGGFDFGQSNFNRATDARRQPGSGIKPFLFAAAFDKGYTPASLVLDAPLVIDSPGLKHPWRPKDSHDTFLGPIRLREALARSINLVPIRLMRDIGIDYSRDYIERFGFDAAQLPNNLTLALGTASLSPLQMAEAYATFANGGFGVSAYYIDRIEDGSGHTVSRTTPAVACREYPETRGAHRAYCASRIISPQIAYLLADMMTDVTRPGGTAARANLLDRDDIAGKTGTTNDHHDAWFNGFNGDLVTTVWTGFDRARTLGLGEDGSAASLPIWMYFMHDALAGAPLHAVPQPTGIVTAMISPASGLLAGADDTRAISEKFVAGTVPQQQGADSSLYESQNSEERPLF
jgi:penicillin-binding protein 1A